MKVLVVAAWEPELTRIRERSAGAAVAFGTVGVGVVEAAMGAAERLAEHRPDVALLVGTAGALPGPSALPIGSVVAAHAIRLVDAGLLDGRAELPPPLPAAVTTDPRVHAALVAAGARNVQIANTIGITTSDVLAAALAGTGAEVEHLEAFAFARACARANVPCGVVLGIANGVGSRGRPEWLANHVAASAAAGDLAWDALAAVIAAIS